MKKLTLLLIVSLFISCFNNEGEDNAFLDVEQDKKDIRDILNTQQNKWNTGDLEGFMQVYIKLDSLYFVGTAGVKYGWKNTLNGYKKGYPTPEHLGKLNFKIKHINLLGNNHALVIGKYFLTRKENIGNDSGTFSLVLKKIQKGWKIISDHTSKDTKVISLNAKK